MTQEQWFASIVAARSHIENPISPVNSKQSDKLNKLAAIILEVNRIQNKKGA